MSENLSIDEIIRRAEEIRTKTVKTAQSALEDIDSTAKEITQRNIEVPKPDVKNIQIKSNTHEYRKKENIEKTAVVSKEIGEKSQIGADEKTRIVDQKTRHVEVSEKTGVVGDVKEFKKKTSFFQSRSSEPVYSKNPPEMVEKPATIKSKSRFDKTSDLQEVPTIVAVDELEKTRISLGGSNFMSKPETDIYESDEGEQIVLEGFEDSTEEISKIDEELAEKQLRERRKDKINKFRLFSPDEIENETSKGSAVRDEYENDDDKTAFLEKLFSAKSSVSFKMSVTLALGIVIGFITAFKNSAYLPTFLMSDTVYFSVLSIIYAVVMIVNIKTILHGFNFKYKINSDFPISAVSIIVLVHTVLMIFDSDFAISGGNAYPLAATFAIFMGGLGRRIMLTRIIKNFEFLVAQEETHTVETIANTVDATIISRGVLTGEANLKTSIKTDFTTKFLDISSSDEPADKIAAVTGSVMMVLSLILFVVFSAINKDWHIGFNIGVCALSISLPCISLFCTNSTLLGISQKLKDCGAMINGFKGAQMVDDANAIVIEAQDLFGPNSCEIHGIKTFNGAKADDVILKTAAVIMKTKSPLSYVFDDVIIGKQTILPDVDGVIYEDRLGTSAWIYRKKILVGTRDLLIHHGVRVPKEDFEKKYTRKGRKILYLAVTGTVMAMFVVSYNADPKLKRALRKLEKSGMTILVKSSDPFINDESIAELFSLPEGYVRVMNSSNGRVFEKYSDMCVEKSPAYVVHNGSALGFVSAMEAAESIEDTRRLLSVLISFGCAIGLGVVALLGFIGGLSQLGALNVVIFQAVWCAFIEVVSRIKML